MNRFRILVFFICLYCTSYSQYDLSKDASVSILTCDPGHEIYSLFGHTAIRVKDPATMLDVVFNYGAFDFSTPNFSLRFSRGDLQYFVTAESYQDFIFTYVMEKRNVHEQMLNLTVSQKQQLFNTLSEVLQSDERFYTYKFIDRNCTNMAVAAVNDVLGKDVIVKRNVDGRSYREVIYPYFDNHFYEQWGTSILFGTKTDEKATTLFLPSEFMHSLAVTKIDGNPIASNAKTILRNDPVQAPKSWWNNVYTYLLLITLVLVFNNRRFVIPTWFTIIGLLGLFSTWATFYSLHEELRSNYNILLFNPLLLILAWLINRYAKATLILSSVCLACIAVYLIIIFEKPHALIVFPIVLANAALLIKLIVKNRRLLSAVK